MHKTMAIHYFSIVWQRQNRGPESLRHTLHLQASRCTANTISIPVFIPFRHACCLFVADCRYCHIIYALYIS